MNYILTPMISKLKFSWLVFKISHASTIISARQVYFTMNHIAIGKLAVLLAIEERVFSVEL